MKNGDIINPSDAHKNAAYTLALTKRVKKHIPDAVLWEQRGDETVYVLPIQSMPLYEKLLIDLEKKRKILSIRSYGLSDTTLEEVSVLHRNLTQLSYY